MKRAWLGGSTLVALALLVGSSSGQAASEIAAAQRRTADVATTVQLSQQPFLHAGTGVLLGLGLGIVLGSVSMFAYWNTKLS
ncbi:MULTISPECIES: hypothetical protein [Haloarcula]|uniref:hypothetical protein n=1 Tax=Haloarcula TaxID=2237 RepID=UPI000F8C8BB0|nr:MULTISPECIES: hypothetical protein [Haloarcula]NHX40279.1 hypothetical protein [Haloarcula sp. R1-2]